MEATQYQALVGNDWLSKVNATLDWNTQELQLTFNGQYARVSATCRHFKNQCTEEPLIEFKNTSMPPTIETYQVLWADDYRTELPPPPTWKERGKGRAKEELQLSSLRYNGPPPPNTIAGLVYWKDLDDQNDKASGTTHRASHVAKSCQIKDSGMMCLAEEKHVTRLELAPTREEQEQRLANLNTKLCDHCLIPCHFQYCDECDLMFNLPPRILFPITELPESEKEVLITKNMLFQDPTEDTKTEQYLMYPNLSKELKLKWYSDNEEEICPERAHDTDASFDLRYPRQSPIIIAPHSLVKIDLKIALEIPVSTIVQVAFRSSLAKKKINIKEEIIDAKLGLTARGINEFRLSGRGNIPVNFTEEDSNQVEFIHTDTVISIPSYRQYILKIQDQVLLFEASPEICFLADVANLYLPAKAHKHFKISIYNPTEDVIEISKGILVGSISADSQNPEKPQFIPDFAQLFLFCDITSQVWNLPKESYLFTPEEINKLNLGNLILLNQYADVFASENKFGPTDIVKHQIDTGDARLIKQ
ncbi:hypothetical protein G9A89_018927 [Geosiphon pyriformis]|nr:hypothetical protein G9A89_018927 [Geosiphon pyriformis]